MSKEVEILDMAIEVLKATGWCMGKLGDTEIKNPKQDGEHCAIGALGAGASIVTKKMYDADTSYGVKATSRMAYGRVLDAVYNALPKNFRESYEDYEPDAIRQSMSLKAYGIVEWNDQLDEKGKPKVLAVFRKAKKAFDA